jgi:hypothetical protein
VGIPLVHDFHTEVSAVQDIGPSVDDTRIGVSKGLNEVQTVEVESHGTDTESGEPDTDNWPSSKEEVEGTGVVE